MPSRARSRIRSIASESLGRNRSDYRPLIDYSTHSVPPDMTEAYTARKVKELLTTDWDDLARVEISKRGLEARRPMLRTSGLWEHPSWSKKVSSAAIERITSELPGHV